MIRVSQPSAKLTKRLDIVWSKFSTKEKTISRHEIFPDICFKLVFRFSSDKPSRMVLIGPVTEKTTIEIDESSDYFGLRFQSGWIPDLTKSPIPELVDNTRDIHQINGVDIQSLGRQMSRLKTHESRQMLMEGVISSLSSRPSDPFTSATFRFFKRQCRSRRMAEIARRTGAHRRYLERHFNREIGISPQKVYRMVRLRKVLSSLYERRFRTLSELAANCGFADQSHLIRDFKRFTGHLPGDPTLLEPRPITGHHRTRHIFPYKS